MVFRMARPTSRKVGRLSQFFTRIPRDLLAIAPGRLLTIGLPPASPGGCDITIQTTIGRTHVRFSLQATDDALVKLRHAAASERILREWAGLRAAPVSLTPYQRQGLAGVVYKAFRAALRDDPILSEDQWRDIAEGVSDSLKPGGPYAALLIPLDDGRHLTEGTIAALERSFGKLVDATLSREALIVPAESRLALLRDVARAMQEQAQQAAREAGGDYRDPNVGRFPDWVPGTPAPSQGLPSILTFEALFNAYVALPGKQGQRADATVVRYRKIITEAFPAFLLGRAKHVDAARVVKGDVVAWRDSLLLSGLTAKTVKDVKLAALRAAFHCAHSDGLLPSNPAAGINMGSTRRAGAGDRESGLNNDEAYKILSLALAQGPGRRSAERARAIRWVPWIQAYTGARVSEVAQLRGIDFLPRQDAVYMRFTPEAGSIKSGKYRDVPVHPHLVEQGLLALVKEVGNGPLFHSRTGSAEESKRGRTQVAAHLREWVRGDVGVKDKRVSPTHAWRHRLTTVWRATLLSEHALAYICGQRLPGMAAIYGDMAGLAIQMERVPRIELSELQVETQAGAPP